MAYRGINDNAVVGVHITKKTSHTFISKAIPEGFKGKMPNKNTGREPMAPIECAGAHSGHPPIDVLAVT
jgi:hypothetical protein